MNGIAPRNSASTSPQRSVKLADVIAHDPVAQHLLATDHVRRTERDGRLHIVCPWEDEHAIDAQEGPATATTTYVPAPCSGSDEGRFECLHSSCATRSNEDFLNALDYRAPPPLPARQAQPATIPTLNAALEITVFPDVQARAMIPQRKTWAEIVDMLAKPEEHASKVDCPLLKLATFGDKRTPKGSLRHDANLLQVFGVEGDYDAGTVQPKQAAEMLEAAGVEALVYTTPSHTAQAPRWRVVAPLSAACKPDERARFVGMLNAALGGILAPESFKPSQTYYFGRVRGAVYDVRRAKGACIDTLLIEPVYPRAKEPKAEAAGANRAAVIERVDDKAIADLRSALEAIDADPYVTWTDVGNNLACLGDVGRELWLEWSARSSKFDQNEAVAKWGSFSGDRSDYRAVFTKAAEAGWQNPGPGAPVSPEEFVDIAAQERDQARGELEALDYIETPTPERVVELAAKAMLDAAPWLARYNLRPPRAKFSSTPMADLRASPRLRWLVKQVLPKAEIGMLFGPSGVGKSFAVIDLALAIARGVPWRDRSVEQARVAYVVAEGARGFWMRLEAYERQHQIDLDEVPFAVHERDVPNLLKGNDAAALGAQINAEGGAGLIIIDTLAQRFRILRRGRRSVAPRR